MVGFQKYGNHIPFFLGELCVLQRCIPFLGRIRRFVVLQLSFFRAISLHLLLECRRSFTALNMTMAKGISKLGISMTNRIIGVLINRFSGYLFVRLIAFSRPILPPFRE